MEPPPERSKRLHNFPLPHLRWGQQRYLRCVNLPSSSNSPQHHNHQPSPSSSSPDHAHAPRSGAKNGEVVAAARPWNLRTRRAACSEPPGGEESPAIDSSLRRNNEIGVKRSTIISSENDDEKLKFSIPLTREEIEQDFSIAFGKKPSRRPKKRPRLVQKKLNTIFPGLWLNEEVTIDLYNGPGGAQDT
ncbi:PREDICTED: uncharacterized protein LOC104758179 [Camelina sativa]|uniref:Uncharacterized protein LOC104758179 n=1 Tax=Camelina sativa TaxID=90675 RepID=A0ABM0X1P8_CAMSA|nr:PREDICTED: uncharacterized protein LOC104758179 [Camelina sativa]